MMPYGGISEGGAGAMGLARTHEAHFGAAGRPEQAKQPEDPSFGRMVLDGLDEVSRLDSRHQELAVQSVVEPDSVHPHDVTIAASEASMALQLTQNVVDRVIQAYRDITTVR